MLSLRHQPSNEALLPQVINTRDHGPHVSLVLPFEKEDTEASRHARFHHALEEATRYLTISMSRTNAMEFLDPVRKAFFEMEFPGNVMGVAFYRSENHFYHAHLDVPTTQLSVVAESFHIKPLMHSLAATSICYGILITGKRLRVFKVSGRSVTVVKTYGNEFQCDSTEPAGRSPLYRRRESKELTERYIRSVTRELVRDLNLRRKDVAILGPRALRKRLKSELLSKSNPRILLESTMYENLEQMATKLSGLTRAKIQEKSQKYVKGLARSRDKSLISNSLQEIAEAAAQGRIEKLLIDPTIQVWGLFDRSRGLVRTYPKQISDRDDCVIDDIAEEVVRRGGEVVFFDATSLENVAPYMATLRW